MLHEMSRGGGEMSWAEWASRGLRCDQAALRGIATDQSFHFGEPGVNGHENAFVRARFDVEAASGFADELACL